MFTMCFIKNVDVNSLVSPTGETSEITKIRKTFREISTTISFPWTFFSKINEKQFWVGDYFQNDEFQDKFQNFTTKKKKFDVLVPPTSL